MVSVAAAFLRFDLLDPESLSNSRDVESLFLSSLWIISVDVVLFAETLLLLAFALDV